MTNIRNTTSPHWRRWLGPEHCCLVPFTAFSEYETTPDGKKVPVWFARGDDRPLTLLRRALDGLDIDAEEVRERGDGGRVRLPDDASDTVGAIHPKAMPVILTTAEEMDIWLWAPWAEAAALQRPLPGGVLEIVARGERKDGETVGP